MRASSASLSLSSTRRIWATLPPASSLFIVMPCFIRNGEVKGAAVAQLGFHPDAAAMARDHAAADGQADAGAGIDLLVVKALEDLEYFFVKFWLDADAVVGD